MASYVSPEIRDRFDTLSADLKNLILDGMSVSTTCMT